MLFSRLLSCYAAHHLDYWCEIPFRPPNAQDLGSCPRLRSVERGTRKRSGGPVLRRGKLPITRLNAHDERATPVPGPAFILRIARTLAQDGASEHWGSVDGHVESAAGADADWC